MNFPPAGVTSDKPLSADACNNSDVWADDIHVVVTKRQLVKPLLVGWSMSSAFMLDYVAKYGDANLSGLVFVSAVTKLGGPMLKAGQIGTTFASPNAVGLFSEHIADLIPAWNFVNRALRPDAKTLLWPTGDHTPQWENAAAFNMALHSFITELN
jgi:pimeloyl-ACP methyl ester carboxylesterase